MSVKVTDRETGAEKLQGDTLKGILESAILANTKIERGKFPVEPVKNADLTGLAVDDSDMAQARLSNCTLDDAVVTQTTLQAAAFSKVKAHRARFQVDASGAALELDATDAVIEDSRFRGAVLAGTFSGTKFNKCVFEGADLRGANLTGASFDEACRMDHCLLIGGQLDHTAFNLHKHDILGAFLYLKALDAKNATYQAFALLIRERTDLCGELYEHNNKVYSDEFLNWALNEIGIHIENNPLDSIDKDFLKSVIQARPSEVLALRSAV